MTQLRWTKLVLCAALLVSPAAFSADDKPKGATPAPRGAAAKDKEAARDESGGTYSVVQIGNEVKVVKDSEVKALRDKVDEDFKKTLAAYEEAKKAAAKTKKKFADPKPTKPVFKSIATALKSIEDANARRDKLVAKLEAEKKKPGAEHPGKGK